MIKNPLVKPSEIVNIHENCSETESKFFVKQKVVKPDLNVVFTILMVFYGYF